MADLHTKGNLASAEIQRLRRRIGELEESLAQCQKSNAENEAAKCYMQFILDSIPDMVFCFSSKGVFLDYHGPTELLYSDNENSLIGKSCDEVLPPSVAYQCRQNIQKALETSKAPPFEYQLEFPMGTRYFVAYMVATSDDKVLAFVRNISLRKKTLFALAESQQKSQVIFDEAPIGIVIVSTSGRIVRCNWKIQDMLGLTKQELIGMQIADLAKKSDSVKSLELWQELVAGKINTYQLDKRYRQSEGDFIWLNLRATMINSGDGTPKFAIMTFNDITERKKAEDQIKNYSEKLEYLVKQRTGKIQELEQQKHQSEKLAAAGRVAARVAHEINNPLAAIKGSFTLFKKDIPAEHPRYRFLGIIDKEIDRIAQIIKQMYSLYGSERQIQQISPANNCIKDIIVLHKALCDEKTLTIKFDHHRSTDYIKLPEGILKEAFYNLLRNAIDASPAKGVIEVNTAICQSDFVIEVIDQGRGIDPEDQGRIFEPFFTTKDIPGKANLGMGLSVAKSMVESMGGDLDFKTSQGGPTTFTLKIPFEKFNGENRK